MSDMNDPACSSARLDRTFEDQSVPSQNFMMIAEITDKNTDKMSVQSGEREGDGVEVVEKLGCGGVI
jgi:hypothetical protein